MSVIMPVGALLAAVLVLIPLHSHWKARNVPTISMIIWLCLVNITRAVNAIVWRDNLDLKLLVWCDIVTRLDVAATVALPAACFCLCMQLESVSSVRHITITQSLKKRRMIVDALICFGFPAVYLGLFYIVQGHRFDIIEGFGCRAEDYVSIPEFFLVWLPPLLFAIGTFVFAGLSFYHFMRRRITFAKDLATSNSSLTPGRFLRLMAMAVVEMIWVVTLIAVTLWSNYRDGLRPWTNWDDVHSNWSNINRFPLAFIPLPTLRLTYFLWWTTPISAFIFVLFFAFGQDAIGGYRLCLSLIRRRVLKIRVPLSAVPLSYSSRTSVASKHVDIKQSSSYDSTSTPTWTETDEDQTTYPDYSHVNSTATYHHYDGNIHCDLPLYCNTPPSPSSRLESSFPVVFPAAALSIPISPERHSHFTI